MEPEKDNNYLVIKFEAMEGGHWIFEEVGVDFKFGKYNVSGIQANKTFTDASNGELFRGQTGHSYECEKSHSLPLESANSTDYNVTVEFNKVKVQPFENDGKEASATNSCPSGENTPKSSSIVPIAVGCALAGLIVIVLIAYLIGRRKSDSRGYQQV